MKRVLTVVLTVLIHASPLLAAPSPAVPDPSKEPPQSVSLQGLIDEALANSPGLQAKRRAYEAARARVLSAWLPDDPEIGVDAEGQRRFFAIGTRSDNESMLSQTIPFPTTLWLREQRAMREAQIADQEYRERARDIVWHIEQPYDELFMAQRTLQALDAVDGVLQRVASTARARYEANQASQQDLLKVQIESAKLAIDRVAAQQRIHLSEAHLSHVLNRPLDTRYAIQEPARRTAPWSLAELERMAVATRPELKAFELRIRQARTERWLARTQWLPELTGRLEARSFPDQRDKEYDTFIGITVPVWSLLRGVGGEWRAAAKDVQAAEATYAEMKNEVLLAVHEAESKLRTAEYAVTQYEQAILPQARQQVDVALSSYEAGREPFLNLLDGQRMYRDAQIAYYKAVADSQLGLADLRLAVGDELRPPPAPSSNPTDGRAP